MSPELTISGGDHPTCTARKYGVHNSEVSLAGCMCGERVTGAVIAVVLSGGVVFGVVLFAVSV